MCIKNEIPSTVHFQYGKLLFSSQEHVEFYNSFEALSYVGGVKYDLLFEMDELLEPKIMFNVQ